MKTSDSNMSALLKSDPSRPGELLATPSRPFDENRPLDVFTEAREALKEEWFKVNYEEYFEYFDRKWEPHESRRLESQMVQLWSNPSKLGERFVTFAEWQDRLFCNKATVFYWLQSATVTPGDADALVILGSIWNAWTAALGKPQVELGDFFAEPVGVDHHIAKNVPEILEAHKYICAQIRGTLEKARLEGTNSLITVFDEYKYVRDAYKRQPDGFHHFDNVAQHQSILIVRTGNKHRLSAPISFESLKHEALPLAKSEQMVNIDVIRVPLQVGVRFLASLFIREEAAFPDLAVAGRTKSKEADNPIVTCERDAVAWVESALARVQEEGKISPSSTVAEVTKAVLGHDVRQEKPELKASDSPCFSKILWK